MKKHVRFSGNRYSFRLRIFDRYVDAGESYEDEISAAFAADLGKFYLREFFFITKNAEASLDGETFSMMAHRNNVTLSDRSSVEASLSPGVKSFLLTHRDALGANAESNRPERKSWEVLRADPSFISNPAIREWVLKAESIEQDVKDFLEIDSRSFTTRIEVAQRAMQTAMRSLGVASRMVARASNLRLVERARILAELLAHIEATEAHIRFISDQFSDEEARLSSALAELEATRPSLT